MEGKYHLLFCFVLFLSMLWSHPANLDAVLQVGPQLFYLHKPWKATGDSGNPLYERILMILSSLDKQATKETTTTKPPHF